MRRDAFDGARDKFLRTSRRVASRRCYRNPICSNRKAINEIFGVSPAYQREYLEGRTQARRVLIRLKIKKLNRLAIYLTPYKALNSLPTVAVGNVINSTSNKFCKRGTEMHIKYAWNPSCRTRFLICEISST